MKYQLRHAVFLTALIAAAFTFVAWMGGYNFDHRSEVVGTGTLSIMVLTAIPGVAYIATRE
jgi:hypothetical protein